MAALAMLVACPAAPARAEPVDVGVALGPDGTATMHGDAQSSDTTPLAGPGRGPLRVDFHSRAAACPTILADSDGQVWTLCTKIVGRAPVASLVDPSSGEVLASLDIHKGALLGGVYAHLDERDRLVLVDGHHRLLTVVKAQDASGNWVLVEGQARPVTDFVSRRGTRDGDAVVGLTPDRHGQEWLVTREGRVGVMTREETTPRTLDLPEGERVDNSISASRWGVAVATSHALYLLDAAPGEQPRIRWRRAYDRGSGRKPGQLSWGTGATPTFFGPQGHDEYVTITDNADGQAHLLVLRSKDGSQVCSPPIFTDGASGTENSAMARGRTVVVASTYGYPYPALPEGAGTSRPRRAGFTTGGMERFDIAPDGDGCIRRWQAPVLSSSVPRWSLADNTIYTVERPSLLGLTGGHFWAVTVDPESGELRSRTDVGLAPLRDTLQMVGTITPDGVWWQGTMTGVLRMQGRP